PPPLWTASHSRTRLARVRHPTAHDGGPSRGGVGLMKRPDDAAVQDLGEAGQTGPRKLTRPLQRASAKGWPRGDPPLEAEQEDDDACTNDVADGGDPDRGTDADNGDGICRALRAPRPGAHAVSRATGAFRRPGAGAASGAGAAVGGTAADPAVDDGRSTIAERADPSGRRRHGYQGEDGGDPAADRPGPRVAGQGDAGLRQDPDARAADARAPAPPPAPLGGRPAGRGLGRS